jgi:hypothetical protein
MAAHSFGGFQQAETSPDLVDDVISLVDANGKSQIPQLGSQQTLLTQRERPEFQMSCHLVLLRTG